MTELTYGSLCTGYDGLGMALALADLPVVPRWMAENDESMSEVLKREHPDVVNVGDVKAAPWHLAPHVNIMSSGDPCQSISIAGRQLGREDERFLWPWVRIAYRAVQPDALFFENVANIVSHDGGRTLAERHEHLREDGYEVRWCVLGACAVGAPHHRHRYYAVAARWTGHGAVPEAVRLGGKKQICGAPQSGGRRLLPSPMARDGDGRGEGDLAYWERRQAEKGRKNGIPLGALVSLLPTPRASDFNAPGTARMERGKAPWHDLPTHVALLPTPAAHDGDARGMHTPEAAARRVADPRRSNNLEDIVAASLLPTPKATDGSNGGPNQRDGAGNYYLPGIGNLLPTPTATNSHGNEVNGRGELLLPGVAVRPDVWGKFAEAIALWEAVTGVPAPAPTETGANGGQRLSAKLPEWMMGLRPGLLTDHLSRSEALKAAGNGVVALAAAAAWRLLTAPRER